MDMKEYKKELFAQKTPYLQWLKAQETELEEQYGRQPDHGTIGKQIYTLPFSSCMDQMHEFGESRADSV